VAAPTGAGKTVVGEFAAWEALHAGGKTFYTTPIKALSNQKYQDFVAAYGVGNVGLLTGDNSINGAAPIVVMTTEVLRNMIYEDSPELSGLRYVVLDEVHYLQNPYRGGVWEEVLIHLPVDVQTVALSATVSNAEEFAEWLQTLRGRVEVIIEEKRPVELRQWYFAADELLPMFVRSGDGEPKPNPRALELERRRRRSSGRPARGGRREREKRPRLPLRSEVVERLAGEKMLPAIYFIFSRKGCDEAVRQCVRDNVSFTTTDERAAIIQVAQARVTDLTPNELVAVGYDDWISGLARGLTSHHAGMIPPFKEAVEELFIRGLVKVVFATETLSLGINMPARTVVIESLMKFTGEKHEQVTPGEFTQLGGRAGRRGIDELGHVVVLQQRFVPFDSITKLASTRTYKLRSSFRPSYNMTVNLIRNYGRTDAEHLVNSSFAQFQADQHVVVLERKRTESEAYLSSYRERAACERGDVSEYRELTAELDEAVKNEQGPSRGAQEKATAIAGLRPGDVLEIPGGRRRGRFVVIEVVQRRSERHPKILALSEDRSLVRLTPADLKDPPHPVGHLALPEGFQLHDGGSHRKLARRLETMKIRSRSRPRREPAPGRELKTLRRAVESHPVHGCPDLHRHLNFAERADRLAREIRRIDQQINRRSATLARRFERVLEVLEDLGYVKDWTLTRKGETLTRLYNEADLLVVEAVERGLFDELDPSELTAILSTVVYETRGPEPRTPPPMPTGRTRRTWRDLMKIWREISREEADRDLELTREPDPGFADGAHLWASGIELEDILTEDDAAGDFVRTMKQLVDLMRQIEEIAPTEALSGTLRAALDRVNRSIVAYTSVGV
jgi:ATP-dependent RNA helicase HelY